MAILTGAYVILGGYLATAINDFIQGIIMLVGIAAVVMCTLNNQGGFMEAINRLSQIPSESAATQNQLGAYASFFGPDPLGLLGVVVLTSLGTWGLPQMVHKFYAIKDEKAIKTGTVVSTLFALVVSGGSYFNGAFGRLYVESPAAAGGYDGIVPAMLGSSMGEDVYKRQVQLRDRHRTRAKAALSSFFMRNLSSSSIPWGMDYGRFRRSGRSGMAPSGLRPG